MYGAGSIGRGFIGPLFAQAGYEVVFIDVNRRIIDALNKRKSYFYTVADEVSYQVPVTGVRGVDGLDEQAVVSEIATCDLMATSLGGSVLQKVSPLIASGFSKRMQQSGNPLNLMICENLKDAAKALYGWLAEALPSTVKVLLDERCGLIETAIGRMVPVTPLDGEDPLHVTVEEYEFLPVDKDAFIGKLPDVQGLIPFSPFSFFEERKLYLHNMGHAICAYLGMRHGLETIADAITDPLIHLVVQSAMTEASAMLSKKYEVPFSQIFDHAEDLLHRFRNKALNDSCERVGRDPIRKIAAGDRLAGALVRCDEYGIHPVFIALGYAAALRHITNDTKHAATIAKETGKLPISGLLLVMKLMNALDLPDSELLGTVGKLKKDLRGNIY